MSELDRVDDADLNDPDRTPRKASVSDTLRFEQERRRGLESQVAIMGLAIAGLDGTVRRISTSVERLDRAINTTHKFDKERAEYEKARADRRLKWAGIAVGVLTVVATSTTTIAVTKITVAAQVKSTVAVQPTAK
jgi:hypothetical protein